MDIDKLDKEETTQMLKDIDANYKNLKLNIPSPEYNNDGDWINEKEVKKKLKLVLPILLALWIRNNKIITKSSKATISNNFIYYNVIKKNMGKTVLTKKEWTSLVDDIVKKRQNKISINQVIRGNAKILNKRVQNTVETMYKNGKSYKQTAKELERQFGYNKNKAKSIAITEKNYYKSEAQLQATKGLPIKKTWIYNYLAKEPRLSHESMDGVSVIGRDAYFIVDGYKTLAPQHFGVPSEDINCHCTMRIEVIGK